MACTLSERAGVLHLIVEQGATFNPVLTWKDENGNPVNLVGYSARMHIRQNIEDAAYIHESTTGNNEIQLGGAAGTITFNIPATATVNFNFTDAVYDLELESSGGVVTRLLKGDITVSPEVTR